MKNGFYGIIITIIAVGICLTTTGCRKKETTASTTYRYISENEQAESKTAETADNTDNQPLTIDTAWQNSYTVTYQYYNAADSDDTVSVTEKRSLNAFSVEYLNQGDVLYYVTNGNDIDYYVIMPDEEEQVHDIVKDTSLKDLSSTFMKLTTVSENLPTLDNVIYMGEETVAGRKADKYIQRAYKDGQTSETVYLWVDEEFGFASRCESYNAENHITASWEVLNFDAGNTTDRDVEIDLSGYSFREE